MKKIILTLACLIFTVLSFGQNFQGQAVYQSKTNVEMDLDGREISEEMKKMIKERMKSMFEKTYVLDFDKTGSMYKEEEKLDAPGQGGGFMRMMSFSSGKMYKNVQDKSYADQREMFGKMFLIKDDLKKLEWKLGSETKKIGNYTCFKATATRKVDEFDIRSMRRRPGRRGGEEGKGNRAVGATDDTKEEVKEESVEEQIAEGEEKKDENVRVISEEIEMPKEVEVTAWYTPEIPISQGPGEYWGLPGLILEVSSDKTTIVCSKIVINPKEKAAIEAPDKGKVVTQEEYNKILKDKMDEMRERWGGGSGRRGGGGMRIRM